MQQFDRSRKYRRQENMAEAYCVKCKAKREMTDAKEETMKNGRPILKGKCPECGTTICKILPSKK